MDFAVFPFGHVEKGSKIVIYGAGIAGQNFLKQVQNTQYCQVLWMVDKKHSSIADLGVEVKSLDSLGESSDYDYVVVSILDDNVRRTVRSELLKIGVQEHKIILQEDNEHKWFWLGYADGKPQPVLIYGLNPKGIEYVNRLQKEGIEVNAIFDESPDHQNSTVSGIPVYSPDKITDFCRSSIVFIALIGRKFTISNNLRGMGFNAVYHPPELCYGIEVDIIRHWISRKSEFNNIILENADRIQAARKLFNEPKSIEIFDAALDAWGNGNWERLESHYQPAEISPRDIIERSANEVLVECGAHIGGGITSFIREYDNNFDFVYAFEPDANESMTLSRLFEHNKKIEIARYALSDVDGAVHFSSNLHFNRSTKDEEVKYDNVGVEVPCTTLDTYFLKDADKKIPTYIRMDIEGAEVSALRGAKDLIYNHMPKLSISVYHKLEDYWEVPLAINELSGPAGYDLFLRHYFSWFDTMCYAVPKKEKIEVQIN